MTPIVAVIAAGTMGSGVARRLADNGIEVRTSLSGRSAATRQRAAAANMRDASDAAIAACDIIFSIVPPGQASALAQRLAPAMHAAARKPLYADCNALAPASVRRIARVVEETGAAFVDGGIIGPPPAPGTSGTRIYLSGDAANRVAVLARYGLELPVLPGPIGAASALKMSYAGITKGFTALGAAMMLAATRAGAAADLKRELVASQPVLAEWLARQVPRMVPKAWRWVAEMEEIALFAGADSAAEEFYRAAARLYQRIASDREGGRSEIAALDAFCEK